MTTKLLEDMIQRVKLYEVTDWSLALSNRNLYEELKKEWENLQTDLVNLLTKIKLYNQTPIKPGFGQQQRDKRYGREREGEGERER